MMMIIIFLLGKEEKMSGGGDLLINKHTPSIRNSVRSIGIIFSIAVCIILSLLLILMTANFNNFYSLYTEFQAVHGYSWNNVKSWEQGGMAISIERVAIVSTASLPPGLRSAGPYQVGPIMCQIQLKVTNNSNQITDFFTDNGSLTINDEKVSPHQYLANTFLFYEPLGEISPRATKYGKVVFYLNTTRLDDIKKL